MESWFVLQVIVSLIHEVVVNFIIWFISSMQYFSSFMLLASSLLEFQLKKSFWSECFHPCNKSHEYCFHLMVHLCDQCYAYVTFEVILVGNSIYWCMMSKFIRMIPFHWFWLIDPWTHELFHPLSHFHIASYLCNKLHPWT